MNVATATPPFPAGQGGVNDGQHRVSRKGNGQAMVVPRPGTAPARPGRRRHRGGGWPGDGAGGVYVGAAIQHRCRGGQPDGYPARDVLRVAGRAKRADGQHGRFRC